MSDTHDKSTPEDIVGASCIRRAAVSEGLTINGHFSLQCVGPDGKEKWRQDFDNLVTSAGKNDILDKYLKGATYTQTIRMGLKGVGTAVVADTQASHVSWLEVGLNNAPTYTGNRPAITMGSASSGSSAAPTQAFAITSTGTVAGCFINNGGSATKEDTTGILYCAGDFSPTKTVDNGDTLNVTYTATMA